MAFGLVLAAYACSGMAGLVYEVSWSRMFTLAMGHGLAASSTVLAAFMGGLAIGAAVGGRFASGLTPRQALRGYAALESAVALLAVALPFELHAMSPVFAAAYRDGDGGLAFVSIRLGVCLIVLLVPAMALGASFPMAVRWLESQTDRPGHQAGRLYAANTIGAAIGAVLAGFVLLPALGLLATSFVAAGGSLAATGLALVATRASDSAGAAPMAAPVRPRGGGSPKSRRPRQTREPPQAPPAQLALAATILAITGAVTFACELVWTRVFALVIGPSTYAFAATVAAFVSGLALGACAGSCIGGRTRRLSAALGVVLGGAAVAAAWASAQAGGDLPRRVMLDFASGRPGGLLAAHALLVALTIVPTAIGIGAAFPLALELAGGTHAPARRLGAVYAVNTAAAVSGSLLTGFFAIPLLGLERTLHGAIFLLIVAAALALWRASDLSFSARLVAAVPLVAALVLLVSGGAWDRELLASGSYKYASTVPAGLDVETALKAGTLVYYRDGATGTVSVKRLTGNLSLSIDGKVDASTAGDMLTQKLLAHLPLLLHDDPHEVCIIGLGSGVTLASALTHPVAGVDVLEISPEVAEASRLFAEGRPSPLDDPRTRLIIADGRTHLALSRRRYDVIVSEPSNPWMAGVAALFTREFFEAAKARLEAHGIICQWLNTYDIGTDDLQSVVATFASVFPYRAMWLIGDGDLLLIGSDESVEPRLDTIGTAWQRAGVADDLRTVGVAEPFGLLSMFLAGDEAVSRFAAGAPLQSDDRMALEFTGPRALRTAVRRDNVARLRSLGASGTRPAAVERAWADADGAALARRAAMLRQAGAFEPAYQAAVDAVHRDPGQVEALAGLVESAVATGRQSDAFTLLNDVVATHSGLVAPRVALSRLYAVTGNLDAAVRTAIEAARAGPDPSALEQLASVYADAGDADRLAPVVAALAPHTDRAGSHYYAAALSFLTGDLPSAGNAARAALAIDPQYGKAQNLLGAIHATQGDTNAARAAFSAALAVDARDPATYQNLALLELNTGNAAAASRLYAEALSLDPASEVARQGLERTRGR